ncbi:MAG: hypothetical protein HYZ37_17530 [Candidatus Solibacter usitatus]|nr:hypothetical protein [Candidatus Solibacter usitatus]
MAEAKTAAVVEATDKLKLARRHLDRVLAVEAAALFKGMETSRKHWEKADLARALNAGHGLPDIWQLLRDLNEARKSAAYGDCPAPDLDAEDAALRIEQYVEAVAKLVEGGTQK